MELEMGQFATLRDGKFLEFDHYDDPAAGLEAAGL